MILNSANNKRFIFLYFTLACTCNSNVMTLSQLSLSQKRRESLTWYYSKNFISSNFWDPGGSISSVVGSNNSYKPITNTVWVRAQLCKLQKRCTRLAAASDKVYQLVARGRWFSPGTPASSTFLKLCEHCALKKRTFWAFKTSHQTNQIVWF